MNLTWDSLRTSTLTCDLLKFSATFSVSGNADSHTDPRTHEADTAELTLARAKGHATSIDPIILENAHRVVNMYSRLVSLQVITSLAPPLSASAVDVGTVDYV